MNDRASKLIRSNTSEARRYHSLSNFIDLHSQELEAGDNFPSLEDITWSNIAKGYKQKAGSYHKSLYADIHAVYKYMSLHYYYRNGFPKNKNIDKFGLFKENWEKLNNARMPFLDGLSKFKKNNDVLDILHEIITNCRYDLTDRILNNKYPFS